MTELDTLRDRAEALHLHGLVSHWTEVATQAWVAPLLGGEKTPPPLPQSAASTEDRPYRPLQAALRLRLELAQALRPHRRRRVDGARLPGRCHQRRAGRTKRRRQVDAGAEHRPSGADPRPHRAVHQRRPITRRSLRTRQRFRSAPPPAALCPTAAAGDRRGWLSLLLQPPCRPDVRADLTPLPEQEHFCH